MIKYLKYTGIYEIMMNERLFKFILKNNYGDLKNKKSCNKKREF